MQPPPSGSGWARLSTSPGCRLLSPRSAGRKDWGDAWPLSASYAELRGVPSPFLRTPPKSPERGRGRVSPAPPSSVWFGGAAAGAPSVESASVDCLLDVRRQVGRIRRDVRVGHDRRRLLRRQVVAARIVRVALGRVLVGQVVPGDVAPGDIAPGDIAPGDVTPGDRLPRDALPGDVRPGDRVEVGARPGGRAPRDRIPVRIDLGRVETGLRVERRRRVTREGPD